MTPAPSAGGVTRLAATGAILCGGRSTRMGRAKALLPWRGRALVEHTASVLAGVVDEVVVVSSEDLELPPLPHRVVRDRAPALGPLAGIREALDAASHELVYVTSTDAPFLTADFVHAMLAFGRTSAPVVDGFPQPLAAVYARHGLANAERLLADERLRPLWLLETLEYRAIQTDELPETQSLRNCNTPDAYLAAVADDDPSLWHTAAPGDSGSGPPTPDVTSIAALPPVTIELLGLARHRAAIDRTHVPHGTLAEILATLDARLPALDLVVDGTLSRSWLVALDGRDFLRDGTIPIGPGDRLVILDTAIGG